MKMRKTTIKKISKKRVRSSDLSFQFANTGKMERLDVFLSAYSCLTRFFIDYLWDNEIHYSIKDCQLSFSIKDDKLNVPKFLKTTDIEYDSHGLSARAAKCAVTQAIGIVKAAVRKRAKLLYVLERERNAALPNAETIKRLERKLKKTPVVRPDVKNINPELNSICCKLIKSNLKHFDYILELSSIGKKFGKISIPVKSTSHLENMPGEMLTSFIVTRKHVSVRKEFEAMPQREDGIVVSIDPGERHVVTMSNGYQSQETDIHGHSVDSIKKKYFRKKSLKQKRKVLKQLENFIFWQINRIPTDGIVEVVIELNSFRRFRIFPEGVLRNKIVDKFSALGVQVRVIDSSFNSQRCSLCGFTNSKNRKGSSFKCMNCQSEDDADKNACKNLLMELPDARSVPLLISNYRTSGFFWNPEGIIPVRDHSEPTVPN